MILSGFSFSLAEHEVAGLIGLNGAGKTTFLKVISGLFPTFRSDSICFGGAPVDFRSQDFKLCRYTVFALKPRLILLDDPVNGLDFQSTEYLYEQISGYKEHGTVLFSSHILESITLTSDRVFVLEDGRLFLPEITRWSLRLC